MEEESKFLYVIGESPTSIVIEYFLRTRAFHTTINNIADNTNLPAELVREIVTKLLNLKLIKHSKLQLPDTELFEIEKNSTMMSKLDELWRYIAHDKTFKYY